jgi:hypothetical protein
MISPVSVMPAKPVKAGLVNKFVAASLATADNVPVPMNPVRPVALELKLLDPDTGKSTVAPGATVPPGELAVVTVVRDKPVPAGKVFVAVFVKEPLKAEEFAPLLNAWRVPSNVSVSVSVTPVNVPSVGLNWLKENVWLKIVPNCVAEAENDNVWVIVVAEAAPPQAMSAAAVRPTVDFLFTFYIPPRSVHNATCIPNIRANNIYACFRLNIYACFRLNIYACVFA